MNLNAKSLWHESHALLSGLGIALRGNLAEKAAARGRLFESKLSPENEFIKKLKEFDIKVTEADEYKRIAIKDNVYYWPAQAKLDSLWMVLAEALLPEHPHYYDSAPTVLKAGDKVLDIGACEGSFCLHAAKKVKRVVAVEPSLTKVKPNSLAAADQNIGNLILVPGLLGKTNTELGFLENINAPEASMILDSAEATEFRQCWTLDTFIELYFPEGIDYIKCDAEGADFDILKSGRNALTKYKPRISVAAYHDKGDFQKIQIYLEELGYSVVGQGLHYSPVIHKCFPVLLKAF